MYTAEQMRAVFDEIFQNPDNPVMQLEQEGFPFEATKQIIGALSDMLVELAKDGMEPVEAHILLQTACLLFGFKLGKGLVNSNGRV